MGLLLYYAIVEGALSAATNGLERAVYRPATIGGIHEPYFFFFVSAGNVRIAGQHRRCEQFLISQHVLVQDNDVVNEVPEGRNVC